MVRCPEWLFDALILIQSRLRSPPINIEDIGSVHLRMRARESDDIRLVRADVKIDGSTIFVAFCPADEGWPFTIENDSDYTISMAQAVAIFACSLL
jgi:vacuolar protein sorting-associated protein 13A/C